MYISRGDSLTGEFVQGRAVGKQNLGNSVGLYADRPGIGDFGGGGFVHFQHTKIVRVKFLCEEMPADIIDGFEFAESAESPSLLMDDGIIIEIGRASCRERVENLKVAGGHVEENDRQC